MRGTDWVKFGAVLGAIAVGTFIAIAVTDVATLKSQACDVRPACLRDWIGALSGWVAAIGALLAVAWTLPHLKQQADEARRQSDYLLGDALPTMDAVEHLKDSEQLVVRVDNWNRRSILIRKVDILGMNVSVAVFEVEVDGAKFNTDISAVLYPPVPVRGWLDRSAEPHFATIRVVASKTGDPKGKLLSEWDAKAQIAVTLQLIGPRHREITVYGDVLIKPR
jgi:hypothetical protein